MTLNALVLALLGTSPGCASLATIPETLRAPGPCPKVVAEVVALARIVQRRWFKCFVGAHTRAACGYDGGSSPPNQDVPHYPILHVLHRADGSEC